MNPASFFANYAELLKEQWESTLEGRDYQTLFWANITAVESLQHGEQIWQNLHNALERTASERDESRARVAELEIQNKSLAISASPDLLAALM